MENLPEQDELVIAIIKKILPYGAFCILPEYNDLEAFLHVSEVAPRWIKNIHEFISEGQRLVVKIHHVDRQKNQVDLSLKRVSEEEKRKKHELVNAEKRAEKLLQHALAESKTKISYDDAKKIIVETFGNMFSCFQSASEDEKSIDELAIPAVLKVAIIDTARKNIKKPIIEVSGVLSLVCYGGDGVEKIKEALSLGDKVAVHYLGAPKYKLSIRADNYKIAEKMLSSTIENLKNLSQKNNCEVSFERGD